MRFQNQLALACLALACLAAPFSSRATPELRQSKTPTIGQNWKTVISRLRQLGVSSVGDFDVAAFTKQAAKIKWHSIHGAPASVDSGDRSSAYYSTNQVFISDDLPESALSALPELELHEALGATGYDDSDYGLSTTLANLAGMRSSEEAHQALVSWVGASARQKPVHFAGGSSVVGGGDLAMIQLKKDVLEVLRNREGFWSSSQFYAQYSALRFEPIRNPSVTTVSVKVEISARSHRTQTTLLIPLIATTSSAHDEFVNRIAEKVVGLFTDAATRDDQVETIRDARQSFHPTQQDAHDNGVYGWVSGDAASEPEPRQSGFYYFDCKLTYQGHEIARRAAIPASSKFQYSLNWSLSAESNVYGILGVYPQGKIVSTSIFYRARSGAEPVITPGVFKDGQAHTSMMVDGSELTFDCTRER